MRPVQEGKTVWAAGVRMCPNRRLRVARVRRTPRRAASLGSQAVCETKARHVERHRHAGRVPAPVPEIVLQVAAVGPGYAEGRVPNLPPGASAVGDRWSTLGPPGAGWCGPQKAGAGDDPAWLGATPRSRIAAAQCGG